MHRAYKRFIMSQVTKEILYSFSFRFTILYGMLRIHFAFSIYVEYEFEHYFNVLMKNK